MTSVPYRLINKQQGAHLNGRLPISVVSQPVMQLQCRNTFFFTMGKKIKIKNTSNCRGSQFHWGRINLLSRSGE